MDFIISKDSKYVLLVLVERLTKKTIIKRLKSRKNTYVNRVLSAILKNEIVLSITTDNDIAFTK
jgi:IS30 family transposase